MVTRRKSTKKSKWLGHRSFGVGNCKNRRGSGNRGGFGNAGMCKHKGTWVTRYEPDYFGKHGFVRPNGKIIKVVHLFDIDRQALLGKLEKKDGKFLFTFKGKVLSTGTVNHPLRISANGWSKNAEKKVKEAGGELISIKPAKPTAQPSAKAA